MPNRCRQCVFELFLILATVCPVRAQEILPDLYKELRQQTLHYNGTALSFTRGNSLPAGWILTTDEDEAHGNQLRAAIRKLIVEANSTVDITFLGSPPSPDPSDKFATDLRLALGQLAAKDKPVTVRFIFGQHPFKTGNDDTVHFLKFIVANVPSPSKLKIVVAEAQTSSALNSLSWPHAKIIVADDQRSLVGGHNLYSDAYLGAKPVFDLSMLLDGPAAKTAARFSNLLQKYAATYNKHAWHWRTYTVSFDPILGRVEPDSGGASSWPEPPAAPPEGAGGIPVLAVGHLGRGLAFEPMAEEFYGLGKPTRQWSDYAMVRLFGMAQRVIRISQQDIVAGLKGVTVLWNEPVMKALARAIEHGVHVYLMLSNSGASSYSTDVPYVNIALNIRSHMSGDICQRNRKLHQLLQMAPVARAGNTTKWGDFSPVANHSKFYMVDDKIFYIGSHNMYPPVDKPLSVAISGGTNQEFGYIVESRPAAAQLLKEYWEPRWRLANNFQVSGLDHLTKIPLDIAINVPALIVKDPPDPTCTAACGFQRKQWNGVWWYISGPHGFCQCVPTPSACP